jgi:hypothetical protein
MECKRCNTLWAKQVVVLGLYHIYLCPDCLNALEEYADKIKIFLRSVIHEWVTGVKNEETDNRLQELVRSIVNEELNINKPTEEDQT